MPDSQILTSIIHSTAFDPCYNLALEERLLDRVQTGEAILYLWQNEKTVVIGKNQNAWKECRADLLRQDGGQLVRRLSGGGAVYHDLGNLNFTFVMDRKLYDLEKQLSVILGAVRSFGIPAEFSGRNDILAEGRKFSGNAFCFRSQSAYHHGTLLLQADFARLGRYLQVSAEKISAKGIQSVQSRVINLAELNPEVTVAAMGQRMASSFAQVYGGEATVTSVDPTDQGLAGLRDKYASWDWTYGQSPEFDMTLENRFSWGGIEIGFNLQKGVIQEATVYSDAMDEELIRRMSEVLQGIPLEKDALIRSLSSLADPGERAAQVGDLLNWLAGREF